MQFKYILLTIVAAIGWGFSGIVKADDGVAEQLALDLCRILQQAGAFSKPESCTMRCDACGKVCQGQAEAEKHMKATGHADFSEVKI